MTPAASGVQIANAAFRDAARGADGLRELLPLDHLLIRGAARHCLIGQPARIERKVEHPAAVLRLCVGAREVIEAWSPDATMARQSLERQIDRIAVVIAKIEMSLAHAHFAEISHGG